MLAVFCSRLAFGMIASLLLFSPNLVNPRFYRAHSLTALGLTAAAVALMWDEPGNWKWAAGAGMALCFLGSLAWSVQRVPTGRMLIALTAVALGAALALQAKTGWLVDDFTSAAVLGTAMTAMLIGHSYLIAPAMSLTPLLRLLAALFVAVIVRMAVEAFGFLSWTAEHSAVNLTGETMLWLPFRWLVGLASPMVLAWMAWQAAKIRSTQSATGILYVVVIFCFLGELTSQLLAGSTGYKL